jgi:septal ring factor EnvC (AmiA/AmiB activator)
VEKIHRESSMRTDWKTIVLFDVIGKLRNETLDSDDNLLQAISKNSDYIKNATKKFEETSEDLKGQQATIESLENNLALLNQSNAECKRDKDAINHDLKKIKQEMAELKAKLEQMDLSGIIHKKFDDFVQKIKEEIRP